MQKNVKLNFSNLEIELDLKSEGQQILELLEKFKINSFEASVRHGEDLGYFCISGHENETLMHAIKSIIDYEKEKQNKGVNNGKKITDRGI